jgi:hypothetical protein
LRSRCRRNFSARIRSCSRRHSSAAPSLTIFLVPAAIARIVAVYEDFSRLAAASDHCFWPNAVSGSARKATSANMKIRVTRFLFLIVIIFSSNFAPDALTELSVARFARPWHYKHHATLGSPSN